MANLNRNKMAKKIPQWCITEYSMIIMQIVSQQEDTLVGFFFREGERECVCTCMSTWGEGQRERDS